MTSFVPVPPSAPPTSCDAPPPPPPANAILYYDNDVAIGATAVYICATDGEVFPPTSSSYTLATCAADGTWQPPVVPACVPPAIIAPLRELNLRSSAPFRSGEIV